jgi:hypothetical protein
MMHTTSCGLISQLMPRSTWLSPNALETVSEGEVVVNGFAAHDRTTDLNKMRESVGTRAGRADDAHHFLRFNIAADAAQHVAVAEALM